VTLQAGRPLAVWRQSLHACSGFLQSPRLILCSSLPPPPRASLMYCTTGLYNTKGEGTGTFPLANVFWNKTQVILSFPFYSQNQWRKNRFRLLLLYTLQYSLQVSMFSNDACCAYWRCRSRTYQYRTTGIAYCLIKQRTLLSHHESTKGQTHQIIASINV
jgi:hypothetical protein